MYPVATMVILAFVLAVGVLGLAAGIYVAVRRSGDVSERLDHFVQSLPSSVPALKVDTDASHDSFRHRLNSLFGGLNSAAIERRLAAAGWPVTGSEYASIRIGAALAVLILGYLIAGSPVAAVGLSILGYLAPGFLLFRSIQARQRRFQNQLVDTLTLIRGTVAAGFSFLQSLNVVIQETGSPTSDEFQRVRKEVELGNPLSESLQALAERMGSDDFKLVTTVVMINLQVGGNLTTILNVVLDTIRERFALFGEVRALTAYARFAAYLLTLLPFATVIALAVLSPVYRSQLLEPGATRYALVYAGCSLAVGNVLLQRISRFSV